MDDFNVGDKAIFDGKETYGENGQFQSGLNAMYGGDTCTILESRGFPFDDCRVAFDSFPSCNHREYHNWFMVSKNNLIKI